MRNPIDLVFTWFRSGRGNRLGNDRVILNPAYQVKEFDNIYYSMLDNAEEFNKANPLEKCFLIIEKQMTGYLNSELLKSNYSCLVPFEDYCIYPEKFIQKFENLLESSRTKFTNSEMIKANLPRKKRYRHIFKKSKYDF